MQREGDDDVWRSIVENFGERAKLDDGSAESSATDPETPESEAPGPGQPTDPYAWAVGRVRDEPEDPDEPEELGDAGDPGDPWRPEGRFEEDTYVPPDPPPLPIPEPDRGIAWLGVVGSPAILLLSLLTGLDFPSWVGYLMVAWFVGGFCYLVARMPKEPRDPWDDGSRV